jgi:hypothetical protein
VVHEPHDLYALSLSKHPLLMGEFKINLSDYASERNSRRLSTMTKLR